MEKYSVIGLMSGTSLDGLDIADCEFILKSGKWSASIKNARTIPYTKEWKERLANASKLSPSKLSLLNEEYGSFIGSTVNTFIKKNKCKVLFIASHGHTIFHQPEKKYTLQIGDGQAILNETKLPVVCDFRSGDVALGGQGAPLVPIGDELLFKKYDACLNLGGFANISYSQKGKRIAFDICPVNIVMNELSEKLNRPYDDKGRIAKSGKVNAALLKQLNALPFYNQKPPRSLGREWVEKTIQPLLSRSEISTPAKMRTMVEHIAHQISKTLTRKKTVLITGGGAFNTFLIERLAQNSKTKIILPDKKTIMFKEALIFAFLGVLRWRGEVNILRSVTGASRDSSGGTIYN